jgi:hypothetical protein
MFHEVINENIAIPLFYSVWISIKEHIVSECTLEGFCCGVFGYVGG